jgi:predicted nucleic acid-binding protein
MRVVSNTSPISNLAIIDRLDVLLHQFGTIRIPEAVRRELLRLEHQAARQAIEQALTKGWIQIESGTPSDLARNLALSLDAGEAEAIALASESAADLLIMDESAGRAAARNLGIGITGSLGVLLKEKREGRLPSMREEMDRLVNDAGFFISGRVRQLFLEAAAEN